MQPRDPEGVRLGTPCESTSSLEALAPFPQPRLGTVSVAVLQDGEIGGNVVRLDIIGEGCVDKAPPVED